MTTKGIIVGGVTCAAALALTSAAYAADPGFCREYTEAALRQSHEVREMRCFRAIQEYPERWDLNGRGHFDWCLSVPREYANSEREARHDILEDCRHRR